MIQPKLAYVLIAFDLYNVYLADNDEVFLVVMMS